MACRIAAQRCFSTGRSSLLAGVKWRLKNGMGKCGNEYGIMNEIPDWSYADSRPSPLNLREQERRNQGKLLAETAIRYASEMKQAKENFKKKAPLQPPKGRPKIFPITSSTAENSRL